jgi:hypothetical protein
MGNSRRCLVIGFAAFALTGCGTMIQTRQLADNEYQLSAVPPGGMFAFFCCGPSTEGLPKKALEICPGGYDKLDEHQQAFEGVVIYWTIRCHAAASQP